MISAKLLNGNIISRDADFSKYIETVSEPGVINGFIVSASKVGIGKARVPVSRSNGESLYVLVISDSETSISGDGDVYINIPQEIIDNGEIANEDGTGIATIEVGTMPSKNALKLATISNGAVTDERNILKKVSDLEPLISALDERTATLEEEIGEILDKGAIDHLEESGIVGEKYTLSDTLFHQLEPISSNCTLGQNVAYVSANTEIHIQRIASGTENNQLNLKLKKVGAPTQNLIVEVRRGVKVDVSSNEAYWYGDEVITSSEIAYGNITTDFAEYTVTFPESFGANQGDLLDIVLYQNGKIVNDINYYVIACDSTQYSEAYSFVAVNGETRVRSKLMPYCSSVGFAQSLLCKVEGYRLTYSDDTERSVGTGSYDTFLDWVTIPATNTGTYKITADLKVSANSGRVKVSGYNNETITEFSNTEYMEYVIGNNIYQVDNAGGIKIQRARRSNTLYMKNIKAYQKYSNQGTKTVYQKSDDFLANEEYSFTSNVNGTLYFTFDTYLSRSDVSTYPNLYIYKNGTQVYYNYFEYSQNGKHEFEIESAVGDVFTMKATRYQPGGSMAVRAATSNMLVITTGAEIELRPSIIREIGTVGVATSYGKVNGVFKGGQFVGTTKSVTTGTIALGNAVGFLEVNYMGEIYKVPYYK